MKAAPAVEYRGLLRTALHVALEGLDSLGQSAILRNARHLLPPPLDRALTQWFHRRLPYQRIVYKGRVLARGRDRTRPYRALFPSPPTGKTILDVGCNSGAYCFMAAAEGASFCLGIDRSAAFVTRGLEALRQAGITNVAFQQGDICDAGLQRNFDVVICLNVVHHLGTIEEVDALLNTLYELTRERLIVMFVMTAGRWDMHECVRRGPVNHVLLSNAYFQNKFGAVAELEFRVCDADWYGPGRGIVTVHKLRKQPATQA